MRWPLLAVPVAISVIIFNVNPSVPDPKPELKIYIEQFDTTPKLKLDTEILPKAPNKKKKG